MKRIGPPGSPPGNLVLRAIILALICVASAAAICSAQEAPPPNTSVPEKGKAERCMVGAYLESLHDFNLSGETFGADLWLWTHTSLESERKPLETMELTNAKNISISFGSNIIKNGVRWGQHKVSGTFRHQWDLRNFPFDRHKLEIRIEEAIDETNAFIYDVDKNNSSFDHNIDIEGFKVSDFKIINQPMTHASTYGDPELKPGDSSEYAGVTISVVVERREVMSFIKLTVVAYMAFLLLVVSFLFHVESTSRLLDSRITLQAGALFATVLDMRGASSALASEDRLTLVDKVHVAALVYILFGVLVTVISRELMNRGCSDRQLRQIDLWAAVSVVVTFVAVNGFLLIQAANAG